MEKRDVILTLIALTLLYTSMHLMYPDMEGNTGDNETSFKDINGKWYFLGYDSYYFLENHSDELSNVVNWDRFLASFFDKEFLFTPYLSAIHGFFALVLFFGILFYFVDDWFIAGLVSALFIIDWHFFASTVLYYVDRDAANIFFMLGIFFLLIKSIETKSKWYYGMLGIALVFWGTWWFGAVMGIAVCAFIAISVGCVETHKKKKYKEFAFIIILTIISAAMVLQNDALRQSAEDYFVSKSSIQELSPYNPGYFYNLLIIVAAIAAMVLTIPEIKERKLGKMYALTVFTIFFMIVGLKISRLWVFAVPFLYLWLSIVLKKIGNAAEEHNMKYSHIVLFLLCGFLFIINFSAMEYNGGKEGYPHAEDAMVEAMSWIKENTNESTMLISYWDYGLIYEYYSDRSAQFKSTDNNIEAYLQIVMNDEETAVMQAKRSDVNTILVFETKFLLPALIEDIEIRSGKRYTNETLLWKILNNATLQNFTRVYETEGVREDFVVVQERTWHCVEATIPKMVLLEGGEIFRLNLTVSLNDSMDRQFTEEQEKYLQSSGFCTRWE